MAEDWDNLVRELKLLRQKRGLSLQALSRCPNLLAALNNPPLQEAYNHVCQLVERLGDDERSTALRQAYAIGIKEPRLLTDRRTDLHHETGRDLKTLAGYEDRMIEELASRILGSTKREVSQSHVFVIGHIDKGHLVRVSVTVRLPSERVDNAFERTVDYENRSSARSLPALLYQLPHDWEPLSLTLAVGASTESQVTFWATAATELLDLMFATHGRQLPSENEMVSMRVDGPKPGVIYAIYWG